MIDAGGKLKGSSMEDVRTRIAQIDELITAAMRFSGARRAYLLFPSRGTFIVHTKIDLQGDEAIATHPHASQLDPYDAAIVDQVTLSQEWMQATDADEASRHPNRIGSNNQTSLCVPLGEQGGFNPLLYMEMEPQDGGFPEHVVKAIELYVLALGHILQPVALEGRHGERFSQSLAQDQPDRRHELDGIAPAILAGVAESIAIEINDALSAVIAHAGAGLQWLNQETPKVEKARQSFRKIASSTFSLGSIVSAYRKVPRRGNPDADPVDLSDLVFVALDLLASDIRNAGIQNRCDISEGMLVHVDTGQIQQAIVNVVSVAIEAMKATESSPILTISSTLEDRFYVVCFSDSGEIIPAEARDAIFDPSYTAKRGSRGIKLAIARTIAQLHGGTLDIARSTTDGTTMLLKLPATAVH